MRKLAVIVGFTLFAWSCSQNSQTPEEKQKADSGSSALDRTSLPIKEPVYPTTSVLDARDVKNPPTFEVKSP